jgi:hypothetical protein
MKTNLATKSLLLSAFVGVTFAFAGPGPQFWQNSGKSPAAAPKTATLPATPACGGCKTEIVTEFASSLPNGKGTPRWTVVGNKHSCGGCVGTIATIRGKTSDTMNRTIGACATAGMLCCR